MKVLIGNKIRKIRENQGRTMKEVAEKAGVSESLISQIERNKVNPAIDTLLILCEVLDLDMEYLFHEFKKKRKAVIVRKENREVLIKNNARYERLNQISQFSNNTEVFFIEIPQGKSTGNEEYGHKGDELGVIIEGECELKLGDDSYSLKEGDSISFDSMFPHRLKNTGKGSLKALWMTSPPKQF